MNKQKYSDTAIEKLKGQFYNLGFRLYHNHNEFFGNEFEIHAPSKFKFARLSFSQAQDGHGFYVSTTAVWMTTVGDVNQYALELLELQALLMIVNNTLDEGRD